MAFDLNGKAVKILRLSTVSYSNGQINIVYAKRGDVNSRYFNISLYDDNGTIALNNYNEAVLYATLPDGTTETSVGEIDVENGVVLCKLSGSMISHIGKLTCDVSLYGADSVGSSISLTSQGFYVFVDDSQGFDVSSPGEERDTIWDKIEETVKDALPEVGQIFEATIKDGVLVLKQSEATCEKGLSAYEIACKKGFEGTEEEWLASLKGEVGEDGHTPQRGADYWTDADIAEIKNYVDNAILGGAW